MYSPFVRTNAKLERKYLIDEELKALSLRSSSKSAASPLRTTFGEVDIRINVFCANVVWARIAKRSNASFPLTVSIVSEGSGAVTAACQHKLGAETILVMCSSTGQMVASIVKDGKFERVPSLGTKNQDLDLTSFYAVILECILRRYEVVDQEMDELMVDHALTGNCDEEKFYRVCDSLSYVLEQEMFRLNLEGGNIAFLSRKTVESGACKGNILYGPHPSLLFGETESKRIGSGVKPFKELFPLSEFEAFRSQRSYTKEEEDLIPKVDPEFPVSMEVQKMALRYLRTRESKRSMNNMLWRGTSGLGKSTGTEVLAALLGMPLLRITCFSTMETQDFLTTFVPVEERKEMIFPSEDEMEFDPESAYEKLTGVRKMGASKEDCLMEMKKAQMESREGKFKLTSSNFIKALEKGYICEVQEMSRIKDQGVPVGLNEYDHAGCLIPKADGSFTRRHKDALVIYTDNIGYQTVHDYDPSVLRRMSFCLETREIKEEEAKARIRYNLDFKDEELLNRSYASWERVKKHCEEAGIDSGICTINELEMFCQLLLIDGEDAFEEDFKEAVIYKATADIEEQEELLMLCSL